MRQSACLGRTGSLAFVGNLARNHKRFRQHCPLRRRREAFVTLAAFNTGKASCTAISQVDLEAGKVTICPIKEADIGGAAVLLTRCFGHIDGRNIAEIREYVTEMLECPPDGVFLVARLVPTDKASLPRGRSCLVIGLAAVSFNSATREQMPTLQPPDTAAYLSNIAVHPQFRRMGLASALMQAAEHISQEARNHSLYLHARADDLEAQAFYKQMGYKTAGRDTKLAAVWHHAVQRVLLFKNM